MIWPCPHPRREGGEDHRVAERCLPAHTQYTRYNNTHLATIKRCVERATTEYVWIVSDICDYTDFDFRWQPVPWESEQIHCWAGGGIVLDSVPEDEFQETLDKVSKILPVLSSQFGSNSDKD